MNPYVAQDIMQEQVKEAVSPVAAGLLGVLGIAGAATSAGYVSGRNKAKTDQSAGAPQGHSRDNIPWFFNAGLSRKAFHAGYDDQMDGSNKKYRQAYDLAMKGNKP